MPSNVKHVKCNRLDKTANSFNCYLTLPQAVDLVNHLLGVVHKLMDEQRYDECVTLWNAGAKDKRISFGIDKATKKNANS
jgi:hypothetical protein